MNQSKGETWCACNKCKKTYYADEMNAIELTLQDWNKEPPVIKKKDSSEWIKEPLFKTGNLA